MADHCSLFHSPLAQPQQQAVAVQRDCHWGLKNSWNSHWSFEPIMQWGTGQSQSIFWPTNHKRVMPANLMPCLIPHWQSYCHQARTVEQSMTTRIRLRELLRSRIKILHIWIWCTNLRFMMKNKKWSIQNLQVASDVINLKIIFVMPIWIPKMLISLMRSLCA